MAGIRLEHWSTLPRGVLAERISSEELRHDLTFAETQLLDAARERLSKWRAPSQRSKAMNQEKKIENQSDITKEVVGTFVEDAVKAQKKADATAVDTLAAMSDKDEPAVKAKKPAAKKTATKAKAAPAAKPAAPAANKKEATVAKKSKSKSVKAASVKTVKEVLAKAKSNGKRIPEDAKLKVNKSFKNPFKEGSGPFKRFEICAKSDGKTYGALKAMTSLKNTTPLNFAKAGGGEFITPEGK